MPPADSGQSSNDERIKRLRADLKQLDPGERRKRIKPSYPGPTDPAGSVWHKYPALVWWPPLIPAFVALVAPADVLDRWPVLAQFCIDMIAWFPFLGGHAKVSSMPQVITLVKCLSFALLLPLTILTFVTFWPRRQAYADARIRAGRIPPPWFEELTLAVVAAVFLVGNWVLSGDPSWCRGCTTSTKAGLAIREWAGSFAVPSFIVGVVINLYLRLAVAFGKLNEGEGSE
jgi:hypothetical protein